MREAYYLPETVGELSSRWLDEFSSPQKGRDQPFQISRAALLVLDMQEYFLSSSSHAFIPSGPAVLPRLNRAIAGFRKARRPVIATRHASHSEDPGRMGSWWSELLTEDHPLGKLHDDLAVSSGEVLLKSHYDAFFESQLGTRLDEMGISQLLIGGVMTHLCCETTARAAFVRGYEVFFLIDGTATYNQEFHRASLRNLAHGFAVLTTISRLFEVE